ncbi:MAG TPA: DUF3810 domain-containing protein [Vicinamibacterales bacterium]|nr:DUF3810 domain-containing protein [Vicinamibacterales bacterium]
MLACAIVLAAFWALSRSPAFVESVYARQISSGIARPLSVATGLLPLSLAEIILASLATYALVAVAVVTVHLVRRERSFVNAVLSGGLRLATAAMIVLSIFYLVWGLNYARAPLAARLGWTPIDRPANDDEARQHTDEIATLASQLIDATNQAYREALGTDDLGRPSERSGTAATLDAALEAAYARVPARLGLEPGVADGRGPAKPLLTSPLMNHLRLGGFYFPWTGEANYNRLVPAPDLPHAVAHEKAHQRGIALEDEANFVGYIACIVSDDAYLHYSGYLFGQEQLLGELARRDLPRARQLVDLRSKGVERDVVFIQAFWRQYEGRAAALSEAVNDTYLRSQGERRGMAAYAASRSLIVLFARNNGGRVTR